MGSLFKSKTQTVQNPFESNPWAPQQGYLKSGFEAGKAALDKGLAQNGQITDFTADMTPEQLALIQRGTRMGLGAGGASQAAIQAGTQGINGFNKFLGNAGDLYGQTQGDRTGTILSDASKFADDPNLQANIDLAIKDVNKGFQRDVGNINSAAAGTGNINSTRAGALEAIAQDDAMDRAASISTAMRTDARNKGLDMAYANLNDRINQGMSANGVLGDAAGMGLDMASGGYALGQGGNSDALNLQSLIQQQKQAEIDGQRAQASSDLDLVSRYMQAIGGNYGSQGFQSQTIKKPSVFQQLVGGATSLMGAWGEMRR